MIQLAEQFPPRDFILEELTARNWTRKELEDRVADPVAVLELRCVLNGSLHMTQELSQSIGKVFEIHPDTLYAIQLSYNKWRHLNSRRG